MTRLLLIIFVSVLILVGGLFASFSPHLSRPEGKPAAVSSTAESGTDLIAYYSDRDGNSEIYLMNRDGSNQRRLTFNNREDQSPGWSPDGTQIVYNSEQNGRSQIWVMNADGSNQHSLTSTNWFELTPDWSPDGTQIVFMTSRHDANPSGCYPGCRWQIYVMNADGSALRRLNTNAHSDECPRWSPDGKRIAYFSRRDGNWDIFVINGDGTNEHRLTNSPEWEALPTWSPDGSQLLFCTITPITAAKRSISVMNADGSGLRPLIDGPGMVNEDPVWSPDGSEIAFQSDRDGNYEIYLANADGTNQRNLSRNRGNEYWPNWQPRPNPTPSPTPTVAATQRPRPRPHLPRLGG